MPTQHDKQKQRLATHAGNLIRASHDPERLRQAIDNIPNEDGDISLLTHENIYGQTPVTAAIANSTLEVLLSGIQQPQKEQVLRTPSSQGRTGLMAAVISQDYKALITVYNTIPRSNRSAAFSEQDKNENSALSLAISAHESAEKWFGAALLGIVPEDERTGLLLTKDKHGTSIIDRLPAANTPPHSTKFERLLNVVPENQKAEVKQSYTEALAKKNAGGRSP